MTNPPSEKFSEKAEEEGRQEMKVKADRYEKVLKSIAANGCCDKCQEAALWAKSALAEKEYGK